MKVYFGRYRRWVHPGPVLKKLAPYLGEVRQEKLEDAAYKYLQPIINAVWNNRFWAWKIEYVRADRWDAWNAPETLAKIIHPVLIEVQKDKQGAPFIDDEDVPEELRSSAAPPKENEWDIDAHHFKRWDWVLDEMIWTFQQLSKGDDEDSFFEIEGEIKWIDRGATHEMSWTIPPKVDRDGLKAHQQRKRNGLRLFGKYYECLWT